LGSSITSFSTGRDYIIFLMGFGSMSGQLTFTCGDTSYASSQFAQLSVSCNYCPKDIIKQIICLIFNNMCLIFKYTIWNNQSPPLHHYPLSISITHFYIALVLAAWALPPRLEWVKKYEFNGRLSSVDDVRTKAPELNTSSQRCNLEVHKGLEPMICNNIY